MNRGGGAMNMRGFHRGRGGHRGGGRGGSFRGGRGGHGGGGMAQQQSDEPCKNFIKTGECPFNDKCRFLHNLRLHREYLSKGKPETVRASALYIAGGMFLYSEGPRVKFIKGDDFTAVTELVLDGIVTAIHVVGHFLFVAYMAAVPSVTAVDVGHIKCYYLGANPPQEMPMRAPGLLYAHRHEILALDAAVTTADDNIPPVLFSGSLDGTIRMWQFAPGASGWESRVLEGHVRGVTSLVWVQAVGRLYSGSVDRTIRVWNPADGACTATILPPPASLSSGGGGAGPKFGAAPGEAAPVAAAAGSVVETGHSCEIMGMCEVAFKDSSFLVSGGFDGGVKVWQLTGSPDAPKLIEAAVVAPDDAKRCLVRALCMQQLELG